MRNPPTWKIAAALAAVYVIWGSTYLAIRIGVETIPPFLMAGVRQTTAGLLLYAWLRWRGVPRPERIHWRSAVIIGGLMLLVGNGGVCWAEQYVPSGLTALLVATMPFWLVLLEWLWHGAARPSAQIVCGLALGFVGTGLLVAPGQFGGGSHIDAKGALALFAATVAWASGSLYSRRAHLPKSALLSAAMEMTAGGGLLLAASALLGEWRGWPLTTASMRSVGAMVFLIVFGSMVGYTAYMWLMKVTTPARASTNAYINPIVAVVLGWWVADEPVTARIAIAAGIIIVGVILIISHRPPPPAEIA
jgi:drug/metabolite transporter (DMT)-like permease